MKSLLIVTENFDVGGLETHIKGEIITLSRLGCSVHLATGGRFNPLLLPKEVASVSTHLALGADATVAEFMNAVDCLRSLIRNHTIECVHAHPFTSLLPSMMAAELEGIPFVLTLHGPASVNGFCGAIHDFIFTSIILKYSSLVTVVSNEVAELVAPYTFVNNVMVLPNGVDTTQTPNVSVHLKISKNWLVVSRLDEFKIVGIIDFIKKAKLAGLSGVSLAGDGPSKEALFAQLHQEDLTSFVDFLGVRDDIPQLMQNAKGVAGMGRVALEGIASHKPVCLVGYNGVKGMLNIKLFEEAAAANFSGRNLRNIDASVFIQQLNQLSSINDEALISRVKTDFAEQALWSKFLDRLKCLAPNTTLLSDLYRILNLTDAMDNTPLLQSSFFIEKIGGIVYSQKYFENNLAASYMYHKEQMINMRMSNMLNSCQEHVTSLIGLVSESHAKNNKLTDFLYEKSNEINRLSRLLDIKNNEFDDLARTLDIKNNEFDSLAKSLDENNNKLSELALLLASKDKEINELNDSLLLKTNESAESLKRIDVLLKEMDAKDNRLSSLVRLLDNVRRRLEQVENSRSWKITQPLRKVVMFLQKLHWMYVRFNSVSKEQGLKGAYLRSKQFIDGRLMAKKPAVIQSQQVSPFNVPLLSSDISEGSLNNEVAISSVDSVVCMLVENFYDGGVERVVIDLCLTLRAAGVSCFIVVANAGGRSIVEAREHGIVVYECLHQQQAVEHLLVDVKPSIVLTHHCYFSLELFYQAQIPIIEIIHNAYHWQRNNTYLKSLRDNYVSSYVAVSGFVQDYAVSYLGVIKDNIAIISNGLSTIGLIRPPVELLRKKRLESLSEPIFVHVANLHPQKLHRLVVAAFARVKNKYPTAKLVIIGAMDGYPALYEELNLDITDFKISDAVNMCGAVNRRELSKWLSKAHVALLPSSFEGFSIATLEYTFFALPSLLSATGASRELANKYHGIGVVSECAVPLENLSVEAIEANASKPREEAIVALSNSMCVFLNDYAAKLEASIQAALDYPAYSINNTTRLYEDIIHTFELI